MFSLFINDLPSVLQFYADDFVIYLSEPFKDTNDIIRKVNADLTNISRWSSDNGLVINVQKTQAMWLVTRTFMTKQSALNLPPILLSGNVVPINDSLKVLGVTLDRTLSWRPQCNVTASKCFAALARLRKHQGFLPPSTRMVLIKALIFSYLEYCSGIFLDLSVELVLKLSRCKNAALRFVTGTKIFEHITPDYVANDILTFSARRDLCAINLLVAIMNNGEPTYLADHIQFKNPNKKGSKRCSAFDLVVPDFTTECMRNSFRVGVIYLWNRLPDSVRGVYSHPCFKTRLTDLYLKNIN